MNILFTDESWEDYIYWQKTDKKMLKRINEIIKNIKRDPYNGIGKPEILKYELQGCCSRRINEEHRIVYKIDENIIIIIQLRYHY
ncbi:MAG: Txe/YoeB family addiction module toxin [Candidatus Acididesulfobacter diazotrophicus]|jgi:toxin YoeB|uniref:Putative mRNA interferase YoeB n=1 Tax=Candidatus Acididesulfobacter diazotrophicus TaxID=2597226 RepID=A0A519BLX9_9DELT|nr:MAG: Txe/YoeB family addiction module toxin [Candidatus Acididesulfobacter diazotrophicus]